MKYHFFGKDCIIDKSLANREDVNNKLKIQGFKADKLLFVNQIHGIEVVVVDAKEKIHGEQNLPKADAIVTNLPNIYVYGSCLFTRHIRNIVLLEYSMESGIFYKFKQSNS